MTDRLLLCGVVGFSFGILLYSFFSFGWFGVALPVVLASVFVGFWFWKKETTHACASVLMFAMALGMARVELVSRVLPEPFRPLIETPVSLTGVVVADPDIRENNQRLTIAVEYEEVRTNILVVAPLYPRISYGETVEASGMLELPEPFETTGGRVFRYDSFLAKDGVFSVIQNARVEVLAPREGVWLGIRGALSDFKFQGLDALAKALPEPNASLAGGLILGGKQGLGKELLNDFITSGLVHIVVLSGYNVMIVADAVFRMFGFLSKRWAAGAAVFTILSFVLVAGAGAASVRAGIMASIALYGRASGRKYHALRALIFAGVLMLIQNPLVLAFDPGFQLSFIATLGLIFGTPITERWLTFIRSPFLREIASSTIAAQIAVLPLLLYQNGLFSLVALPANLLVLPVVPIAMLLSAFAGLAGLLVPGIAPLLGFPAHMVLSYIIGAVELFAHVPFAAVSLPAFPFVLVIAAYAVLGVYVSRISKKLQMLGADKVAKKTYKKYKKYGA